MSNAKGTGNAAEDAKRSQEQINKNKKIKPPKDQLPVTGVDNDKLADPKYQQDRAQELNRRRQSMSDDQKKEAGVPKAEVYDPGDSDGDNKAVSPSDRNLYGGDPNPEKDDEDPFKDTKAAWKHLTDVFGEKVSALQNELEGRMDSMLTPTEREVNNPYAGDDVPASKEMTPTDVHEAVNSTASDMKSVVSGIGEIGGAAAELGGTAAKDAGRATIKGLGIDTDAVKDTAKTLSGLSGLFSSGDSPDSKVPDGNWRPKHVGDLFK
nr:MAG TPA: hypothetical protein [Caudoviricetes sp.]